MEKAYRDKKIVTNSYHIFFDRSLKFLEATDSR